jgi:nucleoside-diphosphate-sugar epimerase
MMDGSLSSRFALPGPAPFTVLGASGYIGGHMVRYLRAAGHAVYAPRRAAPGALDQPLGHVFFAIGLTADFRGRPRDTMDAHVGALAELLRCGRFDSLTYLSSSRVYAGLPHGTETAALVANPSDPSDLYNLSKLAGEALCLAQPNPRVRVARLANVFGAAMDRGSEPSANFLAALIREAAVTGCIRLGTAPGSSKDYVAIDDVARALHRIALHGGDRLYNVASGRNTTNGDIAAVLARLTGSRIEVAPAAPTITYPPIDTRRIAALFPPDDPWAPMRLLDRLPEILSARRPAPAAFAGEAA